MYQHLSERVGVVPGGTNVGIIRIDDQRVILVDTGLNDTTARKVLRAVRDELKAEVAAILITHGHADHFGANAFVIKRTKAQVYAPDLDEQVLRFPLMQSIMLYGGADPLDGLRTKFLLAEAGPVDRIISAGTIDVQGVEIEAVSLAGHSINQLGYLVDGVFFCADVVFPEAALQKYPIPYLYGLTQHLEAMSRALEIDCTAVVPGHGPIEASLEEPVARNRVVIGRVLDAIPALLGEPLSTDDVAQRLFAALDVPVADASAYYLLRPTVAAYLSHLEREGVIEHVVDARASFWRRR
ncbi:MAG TPA: MBL fold metallo-hydrolase [Thermomicrobiales bacterium]|nr:MBL fold metallo-hydrolase [Thermomicrobiales bacterium]